MAMCKSKDASISGVPPHAGQVLLNLDTEDWGEIFIGCAGGGDSMISLPVAYEALPSSPMQLYELKISGRPPCLPVVHPTTQ